MLDDTPEVVTSHDPVYRTFKFVCFVDMTEQLVIKWGLLDHS